MIIFVCFQLRERHLFFWTDETNLYDGHSPKEVEAGPLPECGSSELCRAQSRPSSAPTLHPHFLLGGLVAQQGGGSLWPPVPPGCRLPCTGGGRPVRLRLPPALGCMAWRLCAPPVPCLQGPPVCSGPRLRRCSEVSALLPPPGTAGFLASLIAPSPGGTQSAE